MIQKCTMFAYNHTTVQVKDEDLLRLEVTIRENTILRDETVRSD